MASEKLSERGFAVLMYALNYESVRPSHILYRVQPKHHCLNQLKLTRLQHPTVSAHFLNLGMSYWYRYYVKKNTCKRNFLARTLHNMQYTGIKEEVRGIRVR